MYKQKLKTHSSLSMHTKEMTIDDNWDDKRESEIPNFKRHGFCDKCEPNLKSSKGSRPVKLRNSSFQST